MKRSTELRRSLRERAAAMDDALGALVEINSHTHNRDGGLSVGSLLREIFDVPGLACEIVPSTSGSFADHLVFRTAAEGAAITLIGHLDTVFPPGTFEGYRRDGDLRRGPGVLDMKGGLVVVAFALCAVAAHADLAEIPLRVVVVADEEVASPEGRHVLAQHAVGSKAALVFEAGRENDRIITRRKGGGEFHVLVHGKAAHAGNAFREGIHAIWALAKYIEGAQSLNDRFDDCIVNIGTVNGGTMPNTVPDRAEARLIFRFSRSEQGRELVAQLTREIVQSVEKAVPGVRLDVQGGITHEPLVRTAATAPLVTLYGACAREQGLGAEESPELGGASDANNASALGIATIDGLGPRGKGFHTRDEYIEFETLTSKAAALAEFLLRLRARDGD